MWSNTLQRFIEPLRMTRRKKVFFTHCESRKTRVSGRQKTKICTSRHFRNGEGRGLGCPSPQVGTGQAAPPHPAQLLSPGVDTWDRPPQPFHRARGGGGGLHSSRGPATSAAVLLVVGSWKARWKDATPSKTQGRTAYHLDEENQRSHGECEVLE